MNKKKLFRRGNFVLTSLGLREKGFFTPYDYLEMAEWDTPVYPEVHDLFRGCQDRFLDFLSDINENESYFLRTDTGNPNPVWTSTFIPPLDGAAIYTGVTTFAPKKIVEIGSGNSTHFMLRAIRDHDLPTQVICIDPKPRISIDGLPLRFERRIVSEADTALVESLEANDILFVDSSHILQQGFDLDIILNRLLPRLKPGVMIHFHDIFLPYSYPKHWKAYRFNEQQALIGLLLSGYLEVEFSSHFVIRDLRDALLNTCVKMPIIAQSQGGTLWARKT